MSSWTDILNELNRDIALDNPTDVLQWGADWFQNKLRQEVRKPTCVVAPFSSLQSGRDKVPTHPQGKPLPAIWPSTLPTSVVFRHTPSLPSPRWVPPTRLSAPQLAEPPSRQVLISQTSHCFPRLLVPLLALFLVMIAVPLVKEAVCHLAIRPSARHLIRTELMMIRPSLRTL